jgi:hypothetical protein
VASLASIAGAHSTTGDANAIVPQLLGGRHFLSELAARNALPKAPFAVVEEKHVVEERQNTNGRCGPGFGKCSSGCCSDAG